MREMNVLRPVDRHGEHSMVVEFIATETGTEDDVYFITTGVARSDPSHYLMFSRSLPIGGDEDWGVHFEFDDQINSGHEKIRTCSLSPDRLRVELIEPIGRAKQYTAFDVVLRLSESDLNSLAIGLRRVFAGHEEMLSISDVVP